MRCTDSMHGKQLGLNVICSAAKGGSEHEDQAHVEGM